MRLGGWARLGIVLSGLYGAWVFAVAWESRPTREGLEQAWIYDASSVIAKAASVAQGKEVSAQDIRDTLPGHDADRTTAWLQRVAATPSQQEKPYAAAIARVNERHAAAMRELGARRWQHWLLALALWIAGPLLLFGAAWVVRWVVEGFRLHAGKQAY